MRKTLTFAIMSASLVAILPVLGQSKPATQAADVRIPLTDMGNRTYKNLSGGLYGEGKNDPPETHRTRALAAIAQIRRLDKDGKPDAEGKIVLVSIGMSNTTQEFSTFVRLANESPKRDKHVILVDGAQGGQDAAAWVGQRRGQGRPGPWEVLDDRLKAAGVSARQVQAVWIKQALAGPGRIGAMPKHTDALRDDLEAIVLKARERFTNLRVAYLSSRIYAGYASTPLNPEPYAYEGAFAVRGLIEKQIAGHEALNPDPARGSVKAPVLLWGPYLWANGNEPRKDGLVWQPGDFRTDGTHPDDSGRKKVAELLLTFFTGDPLAKPWFCGH